jgi:cell division protein FtsI/penicillin-binding protein 2
VTPAQIFQSVTVFANNGKMCTPTLLKGNTSNCQNLSIDQHSIDLIREGMLGACSTGGTAFPFFPWNENKENKVYCKTGTAEFGAADEKGHRRTHGWFVAFSDLNTQQEKSEEKYPQKILVVVLLESDETKLFKEGSTDASPIALQIMNWIEENR